MKYAIKMAQLVTVLIFPMLAYAESGTAPSTQSVNDLASLLELDLEKLGQVQVFTAERKLTPIEEAPSVVSVITAEQIKRQGLKSLHEVLSRVPGFFNATSPFMEPISNRGFVQNVNTNYLLLVDGHTLNNDAINGLGHSHMMPGLDRIARIEIVRGPGSTLWGANAAMGIIHLITKDAGDLDNGDNPLGSLDVSYDYEFNHQRHIAQATYGKQFDEGGIMLSGKFFNSDPNSTTSFQAGATDFEVQNSRQMNLWDFDSSHDLYAKLDWRGWMLKAGKIKFKNKNPFLTPIDGSSETTWTTEKEWIELGKKHDLNESFSLEYRLFYDKFSDKRVTQRPSATQGRLSETISPSRAEGFGGETILHFRNEDHHFLLGLSASNRDLKTKTVQSFTSGVVQSFIGIPNIIDKNRAIFFEENYRGFDDWVFTVGLRVDRNTPRGNTTNYLPRAAVSYAINDHWSAKYAFNTGYVAPTLGQTRGGIFQPFGPGSDFVKGAENNQKSRSHDMQLFYQDDRTHANLTLFYHTLTNVIQFAGFGPVTVDGISDVTLFELNASDMNTWGLELEAKTMLTDWLDVYGNYAFANAKYQNRFVEFEGQTALDLVTGTSVATENLTVTGTPQHIWNLGLDWQIKNNLTLNAHYRAWSNAFSKRSNEPSFKRFGVNHYVDLNLHYQEKANNGLSTAVYVKNLFDNDDPLPGGVNSGQVVPQNGRQIGIRIGYQF